MGLLDSMKAWEGTGKVGDGPADVKAASSAHKADYSAALLLRYVTNVPSFAPPPVDAGIPDAQGPTPHPDPWSVGQRQWQNYLDQFQTKVSAWRRPNPQVDWANDFAGSWKGQVKELGNTLIDAAEAKKRIRPIGGAHAAGDVCKPDADGQLLQVDDFHHVLDAPYLPATADKSTLAWIGGGVRIVELNKRLAARGQAMLNMGGYNGQTAAGALCTGTHGSGYNIGALYSVIQSIWIVVLAADGKPELRIVEPSKGFSDPAAFAADVVKAGEVRRVHITDDVTFQAVCQGVGWVGAVYAMTIRTARNYWLKQTKEMKTWSAAKQTLLADFQAHRNYELALSPMPCWQADGTYDHSCLTIRRDQIPAGTNPRWPTNKFMGNVDNLVKNDPRGISAAADLIQTFAGVGGIGAFVHNALAGMQVRDFSSAPPNILLLPYGNHFRAKSCEIHVRLPDGVKMLDTLLAAVRKFAHETPCRVVNSPMGVRVIAPTKGPLSTYDWADGAHTLSIEVPILLNANDKGWAGSSAERLLLDIFASLGAAGIDARLHWGQYHKIDRAQMLKFYGAERVAAFEKVRRDFDPKGLFGNVASDRLAFK